MIKKITLAAILFGLTTAVAHAAPTTPSTPAAPVTQSTSTQISPDWGVKRQAVGFKRRGFRHRGFRRGGYGFRRGGYRGYRSYRGGHRFGYHRSYRSYGYGYRGHFGGSRVRGVGTVVNRAHPLSASWHRCRNNVPGRTPPICEHVLDGFD